MSACMRSLYSSNQWAPGLSLPVYCGRGMGGALLSLGDFLTPALSLSVVRDDVGLEDEFELSMQLSATSFNVLMLALACAPGRHERCSDYRTYCTQYQWANTEGCVGRSRRRITDRRNATIAAPPATVRLFSAPGSICTARLL